ncbi:hypothetical protein HJC23_012162 [Cyclotella cryptica]|uniref:Photosystem I reaction center subunit VIII n=1 Tax=Cyclotella cryptica TaxID=29204 RepID=A0ABD3P933_9STRA|eukprot:CCRYP_016633-RA/>CCRYP_016633-RA protein AED:0.01 eAED:0.01 QI:125/1/1/1/1/1/2/938/90
MRSLFLLALLVAAASAFVAPANKAVAFGRTAAPQAPKMMIDGSVMESAAANANLIATSSGDFGGAFWPVAGIVSIAALILYLAPPLVGDD